VYDAASKWPSVCHYSLTQHRRFNFNSFSFCLYSALLDYSKELEYGDARVTDPSLSSWLTEKASGALFMGAVTLPSVFGYFVPAPGSGPDRATMEEGYMILHGRGVMKSKSDEKETRLTSEFKFNKDIGYLYTAALLVETGMLLLEKANGGTSPTSGGVVTPAVAFGSDMTSRIVDKLDSSWELKEA
jgi:hypothetical protein